MKKKNGAVAGLEGMRRRVSKKGLWHLEASGSDEELAVPRSQNRKDLVNFCL